VSNEEVRESKEARKRRIRFGLLENVRNLFENVETRNGKMGADRGRERGVVAKERGQERRTEEES